MAKDRLRTIVENSKGEIEYFGECKMVDRQEEMNYKNRHEKYKADKLNERKELYKRVDNCESEIKELKERDLLIAKALYDNLVERGYIEQNADFDNNFKDYLLDNGELDKNLFPNEFKAILRKVGKEDEQQN